MIPDPTVLDMVYGHGRDDLYNFLLEGQPSYGKMFRGKKADYWLGLLRETFVGKPRIKVRRF